MKRHLFVVVILGALAIAGLITYFWCENSRQLAYAELEGFRWDENTQDVFWVTIRVDDRQMLAEVQPWRDALLREARDKSLRRFVDWLQGSQECENALRQSFERLTLVYENGDHETVCGAPLAIRKLLRVAKVTP